jgi:hypothetical protein
VKNYVIRHGRRIEIVTNDFGSTAKPRTTKKRDFVMTTRAQFDRLVAARHLATLKVFLHLQFLIFRSHTKSVRLANVTLAKSNIARREKRMALSELECMGLIRVTRYKNRSPEIVILDLAEGLPYDVGGGPI